jgi:hypothetical protein
MAGFNKQRKNPGVYTPGSPGWCVAEGRREIDWNGAWLEMADE